MSSVRREEFTKEDILAYIRERLASCGEPSSLKPLSVISDIRGPGPKVFAAPVARKLGWGRLVEEATGLNYNIDVLGLGPKDPKGAANLGRAPTEEDAAVFLAFSIF